MAGQQRMRKPSAPGTVRLADVKDLGVMAMADAGVSLAAMSHALGLNQAEVAGRLITVAPRDSWSNARLAEACGMPERLVRRLRG